MTNSAVRRLVLAAMCCALIFFTTRFLCMPSAVGTLHLGDGCIVFAGMLLPPFWAATVSGAASALSDFTQGFPQFAIWTLIIKALMGLCASLILRRRTTLPRVFASAAINGIIMMGGYFIVVWKMFTLGVAVFDVVENAAQAGLSMVIGPVLCVFAKRLQFFKEGGREKC